ncbi:hypothetical protein ACFWDA_24540 [Rhodococcus zopfii]|uniref:hypothetical protein n=1 Tax=Rhodococcus zopfii TaxID=43772 RepID=UPI0036540150
MTLTRDDVIDLLTAAASVDLRKLGEADITGWSAILRPDLDRDLAFEALRVHYATSPERVMPAHINTRAVEIRRDRADREERVAREARQVRNDARHGLHHADGGLALNADGPPVPGAYQVNDAFDRRCPKCDAEPLEPCTNLANGQPRRIPCPPRLRAMGEAEKNMPGRV